MPLDLTRLVNDNASVADNEDRSIAFFRGSKDYVLDCDGDLALVAGYHQEKDEYSTLFSYIPRNDLRQLYNFLQWAEANGHIPSSV